MGYNNISQREYIEGIQSLVDHRVIREIDCHMANRSSVYKEEDNIIDVCIIYTRDKENLECIYIYN